MSGRKVTPAGVLVLPSSAPHAEWLAARRWRKEVPGGYCIGSSDVPSILDLPGVDTPAHVFHAKVNSMEKEQTDAMRFGQLFEPVIADDWAARMRSSIRRIGIVGNIAEPWQQTSLDRLVTTCPLGIAGGCSLEIKNVGSFVYKTRWHSDLPDYILAQILHQMLVTGFEHAHYAVCVGGNEPHQGVVRLDKDGNRDLMEYIRTEVNRFREQHLLTGVAPEWTAEDKIDRYLELDTKLHAERVGEVSIADMDPILTYARHSLAEGRAKKAKKAAKLELVKLAGGAQYVKVADELAFTMRPGRTVNVSAERLREFYPEAYADPRVVSETEYHAVQISAAFKKMAEGS